MTKITKYIFYWRKSTVWLSLIFWCYLWKAESLERLSYSTHLIFFPQCYSFLINDCWMTECYKMSTLEKTLSWLQMESESKTVTEMPVTRASIMTWVTYFQPVVERANGYEERTKTNVSSHFLSSTSITEAFCSLSLCNNELTLISCHRITIVFGIKAKLSFACDKEGKKISCLQLSEIQSCLRVVRIQLIHVQMSSAPQFTVRVYKTHFSLDGNDSAEPTKLSSTAVCTVKDHIYLLTIS